MTAPASTLAQKIIARALNETHGKILEKIGVVELIFPEKVFEWFEVVDGAKDEKTVRIVFEEKNIPPTSEEQKHKTVLSKGFTDITITDFPIRGRTTFLTFRRRYWQVEGEPGLLKRDMKLVFPFIDQVVGMVKGFGFHAVIKPESFGASQVADRHT